MARKLKAVKDSEKRKGVEVARGALERVHEALSGFGHNRLNLRRTHRVHASKGLIMAEMKKREELRVELVRQYDPTGAGWANEADIPAELIAKVSELYNETVVLDFGEPIELTEVELDEIKLDNDAHYAILKEINFLA